MTRGLLLRFIISRLAFSALVILISPIYSTTVLADDLFDLRFEDLLQVQVSSASKAPTRLMETAAAISVISRDDIRRSGACTVPEVLRMVPGVHVAQVDANRWAVTVRGFNGLTANKLLVMIDGRSVYTPTFSGTYWDALDVSIEEIERIEVVRGPGAALWGANAVNGVINIITQSALTTQGTEVTGWLGTKERGGASVQHTTEHSENNSLRLSARGFVRDQGPLVGTGDDHNSEQGRIGLRWDVQGNGYAVQTSASYYQIEQSSSYNKLDVSPPHNTALTDVSDLKGGHIRSRYSRIFNADSNLDIQFYYDYTSRHEWLYDQKIQKLDLDLQHSLRLMDTHRLTWGGNVDLSFDSYDSRQGQINIPLRHRRAHLFSLFAQDDYSLSDDITLTIGGKCEYNEVTGWEWQPNLRLLWQMNPHLSLWGAVSRAVRTPAHVEHHGDLIASIDPPSLTVPLVQVVTIDGDHNIDAEDLIAWELGARYAFSNSLSFDIALFIHEYDNLQGGTLQSASVDVLDGQPVYLINYRANNKFDGRSYGAEFAVDWCVLPVWKLLLAYSFLDMNLREPNAMEIAYPERLSQHQLSLQSRWNISSKFNADCWLTYTDGIETQDIKESWDLQLRVDWQVNSAWRIELIGKNLLHDDKQEIKSELSSVISSRSEREALLRFHYQF